MAYNGRGKNKIQKPLTLKHSYEYYLKDIRLDSKYNIDWNQYKEIISSFNKEVMRAMIEDGFIFKLPYRMGILRIRKRENNLDKLKPDWSTYNVSNQEIKNKYLNSHTDNYYVRFYWAKNKEAIIRNKTLYAFIPTRDNKRYLSKNLKEKGMEQMNKYFE